MDNFERELRNERAHIARSELELENLRRRNEVRAPILVPLPEGADIADQIGALGKTLPISVLLGDARVTARLGMLLVHRNARVKEGDHCTARSYRRARIGRQCPTTRKKAV